MFQYFMPEFMCLFRFIPEFCAGRCYIGPMKIETMLKEQIDFTANEKVISEYILSHKDDVLHMSIQSLAKRTYTSTSAVMRMCSDLGLSGFRDFKIQYAQELSSSLPENQEIDPNFPFSPNDSVGEIASSLRKLTSQTLTEAQKTLSPSDVKKACMLLHNAKHVALFGIGDAYLAGLTFQARMMRSGTIYLATPVYGEQHHLAQTMHAGDVGIVLSYSGTTKSTTDCARELKKNGAATVCITAAKDSELAKLCTITLLLPAREQKFRRIASFFSQTCMEYYLNVIYSYLYVMDYSTYHAKPIDY
jgi:DNA-binding MurR/RpiR family transcriptional regulator